MKYYAIPSNNSSVTEKHVVEDDILCTNPLAGKGLIYKYTYVHSKVTVETVETVETMETMETVKTVETNFGFFDNSTIYILV